MGVVYIRQRLDYASAEYVKEKVMSFLIENHCKGVKLIVLQGEDVHSIDFTVANVSFAVD